MTEVSMTGTVFLRDMFILKGQIKMCGALVPSTDQLPQVDKLKWALLQYISGTYICIYTVTDFTRRSSEWIKDRQHESEKMRREEEDADSFYKDKTELQEGLKPTLKALKEMQNFLEAVEKLAVTSVQVFEENQVLQLCEETDLESVKKIRSAAQLICPLLISFRRDNEVFFRAKLVNVEVMQFHLNQYISNIGQICEVFRRVCPTVLCFNSPSVNPDQVEGDAEKMLHRIIELDKLREDEPFRTAFLFQDRHQTFIKEFREKKERMLQFLDDVEACAVQLDRVNKGARICSVLGSSVGLIGGILSIVVSVALIGAGAGLGVCSGANAEVTTATETGVNLTQKKKADDAFEMFMKDMNALHQCLDDRRMREERRGRKMRGERERTRGEREEREK
ncbi:hypothetical protein WMY93_020931 [Mugilogobius chulae]|uniref:Uncharacterized protein n=1 Tax=Mugilogobius chulae TaxID=88201 RepID=A0AAW0NF24_9GOBI